MSNVLERVALWRPNVEHLVAEGASDRLPRAGEHRRVAEPKEKNSGKNFVPDVGADVKHARARWKRNALEEKSEEKRPAQAGG